MIFDEFRILRYAVTFFAATFVIVSCSKNDPSPEPKTEGVKFMVLSDLHYMHPDILVKEGKAFDEYNAEECKLLRESGAILDAAVERIREQRPEFVIVCGDMSKDGEVICHEHVAEVFRKLEAETSTKVLVVPGNHDMNNPHSMYYNGDKTTPAVSANEAKFAEIYASSGYDLAVERRGTSLDYMAYPAEGIAFIGVDSNEKNTPEKLMVQGGLSGEQVNWITSMAQKAHGEGRYVIMCMHHNLLDFYDNAQLIRGANIANARYDYDNDALVDDISKAGIDVVFSGHSHMHSITYVNKGSRPIYSVVTSSLVNLPLAYRIGYIEKNGRMSLFSGDLKDCKVPGCEDLCAEGDKYWQDLSAFYMKEAADKAWDAAGAILKIALDFKDKEALHSFLKERAEKVFYTFLVRTSDGNEHLHSPKANYLEAEKAIKGLVDFFDEKGIKNILEAALQLIFGKGLDDVSAMFYDFFRSAYFNYLGDGPVCRDDIAVIQLTSVQ